MQNITLCKCTRLEVRNFVYDTVSKARLFLQKLCVDDWFDTSIDESLEDRERDTQ